jgi:hypothetical protein
MRAAQPERDDGPDRGSARSRGMAGAWVVVGMIVAGTCVAGLGLISSAPWLFWTGVVVVAFGTALGRITHAIRNVTVPKPGASG